MDRGAWRSIVHGVAKSWPHGARLEFPREAGLILRCAGKAGGGARVTAGPKRPHLSVCVSIFQCVCDTFSAALDGLEVLLALDAHPR